jgi:hypothetical protein
MDTDPTRATRVRARRGLTLPAGALAAALLSAAPAHAGGQCNLHHIFNYDGSNVWSNMADPDIARPGAMEVTIQ